MRPVKTEVDCFYVFFDVLRYGTVRYVHWKKLFLIEVVDKT